MNYFFNLGSNPNNRPPPPPHGRQPYQQQQQYQQQYQQPQQQQQQRYPRYRQQPPYEGGHQGQGYPSNQGNDGFGSYFSDPTQWMNNFFTPNQHYQQHQQHHQQQHYNPQQQHHHHHHHHHHHNGNNNPQAQRQQQHHQGQHFQQHQQQHQRNMSNNLFSNLSSIFGGIANSNIANDFMDTFLGGGSSRRPPPPQQQQHQQHQPQYHYNREQQQQQQQQRRPHEEEIPSLPLPVAPEALQALPTYEFTKHRARYVHDFELEHLCSVCVDEFEIHDQIIRLPCQHEFHNDCILPWLSKNNTCPMCRFELPVAHPLADKLRLQRMIDRFTKDGLAIFLLSSEIENICSDFFHFETTWKSDLSHTTNQLLQRLTTFKSRLMQILIQLDNIQSESQSDKRKQQIQRIQKLMDRIDETKNNVECS